MKARLALTALIGALLALAGAPAHAEPPATGKYYVVGEPVNGRPEYLYAIALKTLGDGNRYPEIAELNLGRTQPDGGALDSGGAVRPGWVLVLPADAGGEGVQDGPLPAIAPRPVATRPAAAPPRPESTGSAGILWGFAFVFMLLLVFAVVNILHSGARAAALAASRPGGRPLPGPGDPPPPPAPPGTALAEADEDDEEDAGLDLAVSAASSAGWGRSSPPAEEGTRPATPDQRETWGPPAGETATVRIGPSGGFVPPGAPAKRGEDQTDPDPGVRVTAASSAPETPVALSTSDGGAAGASRADDATRDDGGAGDALHDPERSAATDSAATDSAATDSAATDSAEISSAAPSPATSGSAARSSAPSGSVASGPVASGSAGTTSGAVTTSAATSPAAVTTPAAAASPATSAAVTTPAVSAAGVAGSGASRTEEAPTETFAAPGAEPTASRFAPRTETFAPVAAEVPAGASAFAADEPGETFAARVPEEAVAAFAEPAVTPWKSRVLATAGAPARGRSTVDVPLPDEPITATSAGTGAPRRPSPGGRGPAGPKPPLPGPGDDEPELNEAVRAEEGTVVVRLSGLGAVRSAPAYAWLAEDDLPMGGIVPLVLGRRDGWLLHADLGRTPDCVAITGPLAAVRRQAAGYARRLHETGHGVSVIGGALGDRIVPGLRLDRVPEPPAPGAEPPAPQVVFCSAEDAAATTGIRRLAAATAGRIVPVILGPAASARWTLHLHG